MTISTNQ